MNLPSKTKSFSARTPVRKVKKMIQEKEKPTTSKKSVQKNKVPRKSAEKNKDNQKQGGEVRFRDHRSGKVIGKMSLEEYEKTYGGEDVTDEDRIHGIDVLSKYFNGKYF